MNAPGQATPFTSDLTIDELLLIEEVGFEPVELVMGTSYYHIGWNSAPWSQNQELGNVSQMMLAARHMAMGRLVEQAMRFGADGVVGMHVEIEREGHHAEFCAMGTAVRRRAGDGAAWRDRNNRPFTCDLSGVDFWALVRGGYRPISLAHGVCVYHIAQQTLGGFLNAMMSNQVMKNMEMPAFTQALYDARELAMGRMQYEAQLAGATAGIVAVDVHEQSHGWDSHILELVAVGTGIAPIVDAAHEVHAPAKAVLFADDR
jgi:uncharacterized protein YbjQ (UPF0145 family)